MAMSYRKAVNANITDVLSLHNTTEDNSVVVFQEPPMMEYYQPLWLQVILAILYACTSLLAVIGNLVVCYIVLGNPRMRTVTNYFIVNLAISDILMAVLCVNLTFYYSINFHWPFGFVMCALVQYVQMVSVSISIFTLVAISLDRYVAIIHPLRPRMTRKQAFIIMIIIWVLAGGISLPAGINSKIDTHSNSSTIVCKETWPTNIQRSIYTITLMILQYFLPLVILSITYSIIGYAIWGRKPPGERERHRDARQAESKKKLVKMFALIVLIFALCYLPIHTFNLLLDYQPDIGHFHYLKVVYFAVHWTAMSNCVYNPFVYCWMNAKFRNGFKYVFRFLPCVRYYTPKVKKPLKRINTYSTQMGSVNVTIRKEICLATYNKGGAQ
ncbi:RYamide receptor-like [Saccoglossus kowalevskii]|uniref:Neuropeptide Y receptor-like n=1 Tax=Saccoglossus kowalevskii TaxID=10224 RepID=A0ABM0GKN8_SACKO|nr:PREDICTED: neuropeptide Y receptor-like [Saccoglossus kowalevskii]